MLLSIYNSVKAMGTLTRENGKLLFKAFRKLTVNAKAKDGFLKLSGLGSTKGFSLISSMVAAGLLGLAVMSLSSTVLVPKKETRFVNQQFVNASLKYSILQAFQNRKLCPCQFEFFPKTTGINTNKTTQSIPVPKFRDSCGAGSRVIAEPGMDLGTGMVINTMQLTDLERTPPLPNPLPPGYVSPATANYSGNFVITYVLQNTGLKSDARNPIRGINPISIPVLMAVDMKSGKIVSRPFVQCALVGTSPPPPLSPSPPGSPPPPPPPAPRSHKPTVVNKVVESPGSPTGPGGCKGIDSSVSSGSLHTNGGGFVASTATVDSAAYVGPQAKVCGYAEVSVTTGQTPPQIRDTAIISGKARIHGSAVVGGNARVSGGDPGDPGDPTATPPVLPTPASPGAEVYGNARIIENAFVSGSSKVYGNAKICGSSQILGDAKVYGHAKTCGHAKVFENAEVYGDAQVVCDAQVYGHAKVYGKAEIWTETQVYGTAEVYGQEKVHIEGNVKIYGDAEVFRNTSGPLSCPKDVFVQGDVQIFGTAKVSCGRFDDDIRISGGEIKKDPNLDLWSDPGITPGLNFFGKAEMTGGTVLVSAPGYPQIGSKGSATYTNRDTIISGGTISGRTFIEDAAEISGGVINGGDNAHGGWVVVGEEARVSGGTIGIIDRSATALPSSASAYHTNQKYANTRVGGDAEVSGGKISCAKVYGKTKIGGSAEIGVYNTWGDCFPHAVSVYGSVLPDPNPPPKLKVLYVYGDAKVYGWGTKIYGNAQVFGTAQVYGGAHVFGKANIDSGRTQGTYVSN